jgi:hypothetical protein
MYSEALNASLQSALGFAENNLPFLAHSGAAAASMVSFHHHQQQREREQEKQGIERPSSVEYASKILGSNASSYLSPSSMSDTENNNNHDKLDDTRPASPLRFDNMAKFGRKRPASADLEGDIIEDQDHDPMHFKRRHPSAEVLSERNSFDYLPHNMSGIAAAQHQASADYDAGPGSDRSASGQRSVSPSTIKEELSLRDISMLRNPDSEHDSRRSQDIKREKY